MKNKYYTPPAAEEVYLALDGLIAQSPGGTLEDMPGDVIFDSSEL